MSGSRPHSEVYTQFRDPSDIYTCPPHLRNSSSVSNGTVQTVTSESYPARPLLKNTSYSAGSRTEKPVLKRAPSSLWRQQVEKQLSRLVVFRLVLACISALWTAYTTVRYFMAYIDHTSDSGQATSLVFGICSAVSSCLTITATLLYLSRPNLAVNGTPVKLLLAMDTLFHFSSSILLFLPALVNFVLLIVWRNTAEQDVATNSRCSVDADIIWTLPSSSCHGNTLWSVWLVLAVVRLVLTSILIVALHIVLLRYDRVRYPSLRLSASGSKLSDRKSAVLDDPSYWTTAPVLPSPHSHELQPSLSSSSTEDSYHQYRHHHRGSSSAQSNGSRPDTEDTETESFLERFRSLMADITREAEEAIDVARSDHSAPSYDSDDERDHDYHDYQRPYNPPPVIDDHVQMLGAYVRRMSTIESMGSWEHSLYTDNVASLRSAGTRSAPSRRTTMSFVTDSNPPSRANSLSAGSMLAQHSVANEYGEVVVTGKPQTIGSNGSGTTTGAKSYYTADGSLLDASPRTENFPSRF